MIQDVRNRSAYRGSTQCPHTMRYLAMLLTVQLSIVGCSLLGKSKYSPAVASRDGAKCKEHTSRSARSISDAIAPKTGRQGLRRLA